MTLLDRLPGILRAHGKTHGIDAVVVILDSDTRDCRQFLSELNAMLQKCDAIYPGGHAAIQKAGWPMPGQIKHGWAAKISPLLGVEHNASPSFGKFRDGLRRLTHAGA